MKAGEGCHIYTGGMEGETGREREEREELMGTDLAIMREVG